MTQMDKHNGFKMARLEAKTARANRDTTALDAFQDWARTNAPKTFRELQKEEQWAKASETYWDALEDDPDTLALWDELSALYSSVQQTHFAAEFTLLGIEPDATKRGIRNAYRRKARKLHPDVGGSDEAFKQLHDAYRRILAAAKD